MPGRYPVTAATITPSGDLLTSSYHAGQHALQRAEQVRARDVAIASRAVELTKVAALQELEERLVQLLEERTRHAPLDVAGFVKICSALRTGDDDLADASVRELCSHIKQLSRDINLTIKSQGAPSDRVPVMVVFFQGPEELEDLQRWWMAIPEAERPDAVCVLSSGCFLGFGIEADGALGLYSMCLTINHMLTLLNFVAPDLAVYAGE
jgi:hypothetical protein